MVERITSDNNFICSRVVFGDETPDEEAFDMCYTIGKIRDYEEE